MKDNCPVTGFNDKQKLHWPYAYKQLTTNAKLEKINLAENELTILDNQIQQFINEQHVTDELKNRRKGIINHLEKILKNNFRGSKLTPFGSYESGLSLNIGDIDLCLQFFGEKPKKVLKKIARIMRQDGMEQVTSITHARVPIVKFVDKLSNIPVDISINNSLAIYNTDLLGKYSKIDSRVRPFVLSVKYWALQRGLSSAVHGTFSSYAWTLIAIHFLQNTNTPILPNLQKNDNTVIETIEGIEYDVGLHENPKALLTTTNNSTVGELFVAFIDYLADSWKWEDNVISVRSGKLLSRQEKGWKHGKPQLNQAIQDNENRRLGIHCLPIEDPFDHKHDLSRVLTPEGAYEIMDEIFRAKELLLDSKYWDKITETKYIERIPNKPNLDLFEDLRELDDNQIKSELEELYKQLDSIEIEIESRNKERKEAITMSKALRKNSELAKEQGELSAELRPRRNQIDELQSKRDKTNNHYIPLHFIRDEITKVYAKLTTQSDDYSELTIQKEKQLYSWFFELQSMYSHSKKTKQYHQEFLAMVKKQEQAIREIKNIRKEIITVESLGDSVDFDELANRLLKELNPLRTKKRELRREIGRLESWLRKQNNKGKYKPRNKKSNRSRGTANSHNANKVKQKIASGDSFSLQDLDVLLNSGGLDSVNIQSSNKRGKKKKKQNSASGINPQRGKRGTYKKS